METKEIWHIIIAVIILAFAVSVGANFVALTLVNFLWALLFFAIISLVSVVAKKLTAHYLEAGVETRIWYFQRYWIRERDYFKMPIPIGVILPFLMTIASLGSYFWLAATQSEITAKKSRVIKRHDFYSYTEMTEFHIALICAAGIFACLVLSFLAYLINVPDLGKYAIYFAFFNMIPLGKLDGTKIFFGSVIMWFVLAAITVIGTLYALLLV